MTAIRQLYTEILKQHNGLVLDLEEAMKQNEHFEKTINELAIVLLSLSFARFYSFIF